MAYRGNTQAVTELVSVQLENSKPEVSEWIHLSNFETELTHFRVAQFGMESLLKPATEMKRRRLERFPPETNVKFVGHVTKN